MKGCSKCIKYVSTFILILVPTLCLGSDSSAFFDSPLGGMLKNLSFNPPAGDMSVTYLAKMFGMMPGVSQFSGSSILGTIFGVFNAGIMAISGTFLGYTITKIVTETTMDGSAMGKATTIWTTVRCALSVGLLVPQASGYSLINGIIMWVVLQSIGLADNTWKAAMEYLKDKGSSYAAPTSTIDYSLLNYDLKDGTPKNAAGAVDVLRSLVCSYTVYGALTNSQNVTNKTLTQKLQSNGALAPADQIQYANSTKAILDPNLFSIYKDLSNQGINGIQFPYINNEATNPLQNYGLNLTASNIPLNLSGLCGTISYDLTAPASDATTGGVYIAAKQQGLMAMISILEPIAQQIVTQLDPMAATKGQTALDPLTYVLYQRTDGSNANFLQNLNASLKYLPSNLTSSILDPLSLPAINWPLGSQDMLNAAAQYQTILTPAQEAGATSVQESAKSSYNEAEKYGWIAAGGYYRLLASNQADAINDFSNYRLIGYNPSGQPLANDLSARDSSNPSYLTLFPQATTLKSIPGSSNQATAIGIIDSNSQATLSRALTWIYLSYPYSYLLGQSMAPAAGANSSISHLKGLFGEEISEAEIYTLLVSGSALLMSIALSPAAIALLYDIPMLWLKYDVNKVFDVWNTQMNNSPGLDPIIKLQNLGEQMMQSATDYISQIKGLFIAVIVPVSVMGVALQAVSWGVAACSFWGTCEGVSIATGATTSYYNGITEMIQLIIFINLPVGLAVLGPMLVSGAMFAIYIPLIPYMLFLFGVISWFISVLVLMAAAPIICFLMLWGNSSNENPLLAREAEQFVMQIIGVFFRPTLMIIGLIVGMVLSYVGVDVLNLGFSNIIASTINSVSDSGDVQLIKQVGVMCIYTFIMVSLVNMCFSTIYLLYSEAMRVAGIQAPATGLEEKQVESVKGATMQIAEAGASGMKEGATSMKGAKFTASNTPTQQGKNREEQASVEGGDKAK